MLIAGSIILRSEEESYRIVSSLTISGLPYGDLSWEFSCNINIFKSKMVLGGVVAVKQSLLLAEVPFTLDVLTHLKVIGYLLIG
jgi:hypothetical protein